MDFYEQNHLFKIFIHQAVLSASVLASIDQTEIMELPDFVNYPLHMHSEYPIELRPTSLNELITLRYEQFFSKPNWQDIIQVELPLKDWLAEREGVLSWG